MNLTTIKAAQTGDKRSIVEIMKKYSNLINTVKTKYHARGYDQEDFESLARIGIWNAINRFDERKVRYIYNVPTKMWRVDEASLMEIFSACVKHNVLRETARVWRRELKVKRLGRDESLQAISEDLSGGGGDGDQDDAVGALKSSLFNFIKSDENFTDFLVDIDTCFKKMHRVIWAHLFQGYDKKEIAEILGSTPSWVRENLKQMQVILCKRGLISV